MNELLRESRTKMTNIIAKIYQNAHWLKGKSKIYLEHYLNLLLLRYPFLPGRFHDLLTSVTIIRKSRISNSLESWKQYKSYVEKPEYFQGSINPLHSKTHLNPIKYHDQMKKNNIYAHINALGDFIASSSSALVFWLLGQLS